MHINQFSRCCDACFDCCYQPRNTPFTSRSSNNRKSKLCFPVIPIPTNKSSFPHYLYSKMNKFISTITMMLCCMASIAQTANEHLTFKGIPIDGSLKEYVSKMESAGLSYIDEQEGTAMMYGDFAGFKGCLIGVSTLRSSDVVNTICVIFPEEKDWSSLEESYQLLKRMLTEKYGKPSNCVEKFQGYRSPRDNSEKLHRLKMDECSYSTIFEIPKGFIQLSLEHQSMSSCFVKLQYWDRINTNAITAKAMDDL